MSIYKFIQLLVISLFFATPILSQNNALIKDVENLISISHSDHKYANRWMTVEQKDCYNRIQQNPTEYLGVFNAIATNSINNKDFHKTARLTDLLIRFPNEDFSILYSYLLLEIEANYVDSIRVKSVFPNLDKKLYSDNEQVIKRYKMKVLNIQNVLLRRIVSKKFLSPEINSFCIEKLQKKENAILFRLCLDYLSNCCRKDLDTKKEIESILIPVDYYGINALKNRVNEIFN